MNPGKIDHLYSVVLLVIEMSKRSSEDISPAQAQSEMEQTPVETQAEEKKESMGTEEKQDVQPSPFFVPGVTRRHGRHPAWKMVGLPIRNNTKFAEDFHNLTEMMQSIIKMKDIHNSETRWAILAKLAKMELLIISVKNSFLDEEGYKSK
jgi:hypothetical protein